MPGPLQWHRRFEIVTRLSQSDETHSAGREARGVQIAPSVDCARLAPGTCLRVFSVCYVRVFSSSCKYAVPFLYKAKGLRVPNGST